MGSFGVRRSFALGIAFAAAIGVAAPASAGPRKRVKHVVHVDRGKLAPDGLARVSGSLPARVRFRPASFALSSSGHFDRSAVTLGVAAQKAGRHKFRAWVALPDAISPGEYKLLACRRKKPSRPGCASVGKVKVGSAPVIPAATARLDGVRAVNGSADITNGGIVTATAADGTTFVLRVPNHGVPYTPITLTPVTSLAPASAVGRLVDGVVIDPAGEAPPGATLEIRHAAGYPAGAHAVAFGDGDPSGGAFPLPVPARADMTIPISYFAGYGVAAPASRAGVLLRARAVPCQAPVAARAVTAAAGRRPVLSCTSAAEISEAITAIYDRGEQAGLELALQAAAQQVAGEMARARRLSRRATRAPPSSRS